MKPKTQLPLGHPAPITRRQFVGQGLLQATSSILLPSLLNVCLRPDELFASVPGCPNPGLGNVSLPFIVFDLVGGASMPGNFVVGGPGGPSELLASYTRCGIPNTVTIGDSIINKDFGLPMWSGKYPQVKNGGTMTTLSGMYVGLSQYFPDSTPAEIAARQQILMGSIVTTARDDSDMNLLNPLHIFWKAGLSGKYLTGAGTSKNLSGGYSKATLADAQFKPARITNLTSLFNTLGMGATLSSLSAAKKDRLLRLVQSLSLNQAQRLQAMNYGTEYQSLVDCTGMQNSEYVSVPTGVDCRQDANVRSVFGISQTENPKSPDLAVPAIAYNVLNGNIGAATIEIPDADYHASKTYDFAFNVEVKIGQTIGRVLKLAQLMQKRLFFAIVTDGGNTSPEDNRDWVGDDGTKCLAIVGVIDPLSASRPPVGTLQVGAYKNKVNVDGSNSQSLIPGYLTSDPELVAKAIALNYFQCADLRGRFRDVVGPSAFDSNKEDECIITETLPKV